MFITSLLCVCFLTDTANGFPSGAGSCQGPLGHGPGAQLSNDNSGFSIMAVNTNGTVRVAVQSDRPFRGFLVKTDKSLIFSEAPTNGKFYDDCPSSQNRVTHAAVTHNDRSPKSTVNATDVVCPLGMTSYDDKLCRFQYICLLCRLCGGSICGSRSPCDRAMSMRAVNCTR